MTSIVITNALRTPTGAFQGALARASTTSLGATVISGLIADFGALKDQITDAIMGCVLPAGLGQAPARQAAVHAGLNHDVRCMTLNKVCGSGLQSIMLGYDYLRLGDAKIVIAGGMESMSNAPYLLPGARAGYRMGPKEVVDHMMFDGLQDPFSGGQAMGMLADDMAAEEHITREEQDAFAVRSGKNALAAVDAGAFAQEITPVTLKTRKGDQKIDQDEPPFRVKFDKIPELKPAFRKDGSLTAANSSSISDGAAACVLMTEADAQLNNCTPLARICGHARFSREPARFTLAPVGAMQKLLEQLSWSVQDVDLFEINEAFACVPLAAMRALDIPEEKVNIRGGACALGHPIGASGARILVTLVHALRQNNLKRGIASLCIGGGEAVALAVEAV